ncbi:MAG: hemerythrin domain-containing protein [Gammaproteobacteria bacterium]|nr:hemerythrin domain-containing protein [Gammaproteobacteria bacterium]
MWYRETLSSQHRDCDALIVTTEQAVHDRDWRTASAAARHFVERAEAHLAYEEQTLFPALAAASPAAADPISVMRLEHAQMRELFSELITATRQTDISTLSDCIETLSLLMRQHNTKEENVLYPIADRCLAAGLVGPTKRETLKD